MPFISTNTWVLKILDGTMSHKMKALGGYALYDEAFAGAREDAWWTRRARRARRPPLGPPLLEVLHQFGHPKEKVAALRDLLA